MTKGISFYDFTLLPDQQQFDLLFTEGEYIDFREDGRSRFVLYKLYGFFVELQYDILPNSIVNKIVFQSQK